MKLRLGIVLLAALAACALAVVIATMLRDREAAANAILPMLTYEELTGSRFLPPSGNPNRAPTVRVLDVPDFTGATAIWGSTGRDRRGRLWFGVSASGDGGSAHLFAFDPAGNSWRDHGSVVEQLKTAGLYKPGEGQVKIHSRIVQGGDGWLYFASTDEEGEKEDGSAPPRWGGHFWRIDPERGQWQHLFAAPEGLVAVAGVGRFMYVLGYWGHVVFRYDTLTAATKRVQVGSIGGHVSRNIVADARGHVFVPRVARDPAGAPTARLVELDSELRELASTTLEGYFGKGAVQDNHGITGLAYLPNGRILFVTSRGYLHVIDSPDRQAPERPVKVRSLGYVHPEGEAYTASLFSLGDAGHVAAISATPRGYEWVVADIGSGLANAYRIDTHDMKDVLLYGSVARDNAGRAYAAGWHAIPRGKGPLLLQIDP